MAGPLGNAQSWADKTWADPVAKITGLRSGDPLNIFKPPDPLPDPVAPPAPFDANAAQRAAGAQATTESQATARKALMVQDDEAAPASASRNLLGTLK
jgi:hypothetical protein